MPNVHIDQSQVVFEQIATRDTDDSDIDTLAFVVPVVIPFDQVSAWEAAYNPHSASSPTAADSRVIARAVLDGMKQAADSWPAATQGSDMPTVHIDQSQVVFEQVATKDTDGSDVDTLAFIVPVIIPLDQVPAWEAAYDPDASASPYAANCRIIARAVLDGMKQAAEEN